MGNLLPELPNVSDLLRDEAIEIIERTRSVATDGDSRTQLKHIVDNHDRLAPIIEALEANYPEKMDEIKALLNVQGLENDAVLNMAVERLNDAECD